MDQKNKTKVIEIIKSVMEININNFKLSKRIETISEWDSFNNLMLISKFQEEYNIEFTALEIENTLTLQNLLDLLDQKIKKF